MSENSSKLSPCVMCERTGCQRLEWNKLGDGTFRYGIDCACGLWMKGATVRKLNGPNKASALRRTIAEWNKGWSETRELPT